MPKVWPLWSAKRLMKRWRCSRAELLAIMPHGLPAFRSHKGEPLPVGPEEVEDCDSAKFAELLFRPRDVQALESDPEFIEVMKGDFPMAAQESRELGQLRAEKSKWDASIRAAVETGIHCASLKNVITRDQLTDFVIKIESLPDTTIDKIWQALPDKYKKKAGRPKNK
jgi:hypothetical protein